MKKTGIKLAIFNTFKTKGDDLTGEAIRQRSIICILASNANPAVRTRTGISQRIAKKQAVSWKNIYSGIFRDIDEVLLPMGIAEENGRLPLKRGPKVLQEKGIPYYHLTRKGILIALSLSEVEDGEDLLREFFSKSSGAEKEFEGVLFSLIKASPRFTHSIFQRYVRAFCDQKIRDLLPFDLSKLEATSDESLGIQREVLEAFSKLSKPERNDVVKFLSRIA